MSCDLCDKRSSSPICKSCNSLVTGKLTNAYAVAQEGLKRIDGSHLHVIESIKDNDVIILTIRIDKNPYKEYAVRRGNVIVDVGISFYKDHARASYSYENDEEGDHEYGPKVRYKPDFWDRMDALLAKAAKTAWRNGVRTCDVCGDTYREDNGCNNCLNHDLYGERDDEFSW